MLNILYFVDKNYNPEGELPGLLCNLREEYTDLRIAVVLPGPIPEIMVSTFSVFPVAVMEFT